MSKKTKPQLKNDDQLNDLEFLFDDLLLSLREDNDNNQFKQKHKDAVANIKYVLRSTKDKTWPSENAIRW